MQARFGRPQAVATLTRIWARTGCDNRPYAPLVAPFQIWAAATPGASDQPLPHRQEGHRFGGRRFGRNLPRTLIFEFQKTSSRGPRSRRCTPRSTSATITRSPPKVEGLGLKGSATNGVVENRVDLTKWAQRSEARAAYMCERDGLDEKAFEEGTFAFANFVIGRNCPVMWRMTKARKLG